MTDPNAVKHLDLYKDSGKLGFKKTNDSLTVYTHSPVFQCYVGGERVCMEHFPSWAMFGDAFKRRWSHFAHRCLDRVQEKEYLLDEEDREKLLEPPII